MFPPTKHFICNCCKTILFLKKFSIGKNMKPNNIRIFSLLFVRYFYVEGIFHLQFYNFLFARFCLFPTSSFLLKSNQLTFTVWIFRQISGITIEFIIYRSGNSRHDWFSWPCGGGGGIKKVNISFSTSHNFETTFFWIIRVKFNSLFVKCWISLL